MLAFLQERSTCADGPVSNAALLSIATAVYDWATQGENVPGHTFLACQNHLLAPLRDHWHSYTDVRDANPC